MEPISKSRRKSREWPRKISIGSVTVKVYKIGKQTTRSGVAYMVSYSTPEGRKQQKFSEESAALQEARTIASRLAAGRIEGSELSRGQREEYVAACRLVGDHPLLSALKEWVKAKELCGSDLLMAAKAWKDAHGQGRKDIAVSALVTAFLKDKKRSGVDISAGYERTLPRLAEAYAETPVHTLTAKELKEWLHSAFKQDGEAHVHPSTFNSHRKRLVTLWKWARDEGYLPRNAQTEIEQVKSLQEESQPIGILKVPEFAAVLKLMRTTHPTYLATAVLAGFAGLRRTELHAQKWENIDLKRGHLKVTKAKRRTPSMRIVHLCPAAIEWLMLCKQIGDLVSPAWGVDRIRAFARDAKISCPENAFRHSFITYRVADTGNVDETALEAGNSREVVFRHYRELVSKDEGKAWFALTPAAVDKMGTIEELAGVAV